MQIDHSQPTPITVGDHIRKVRSERKLTQTQAAEVMAVSEATVLNWEKGETDPPIAYWPAIIAFLGYDPNPAGTGLAERMRAYRRHCGLSIKEAAARARVDEGSWGTWERTGHVPWKRYREALDRLLDRMS